MKDDLRLNMFSDIDLKSEHNTKEIFETFDRFFFAFGRFPAMNELTVVPTGDVPSFVQSSDVIGETGGLVCVHFLAALNVHLGGDKMVSKTARSQFFHNLPMQALSKSDDTIVIKFNAINRLNKILNSLLTAESLAFKTAKIVRMITEFFYRRIFVSGEETDKTELRKIL